MSGKVVQLQQTKNIRNATSRGLRDAGGNDAYRVREHLTEAEMDTGMVTRIG